MPVAGPPRWHSRRGLARRDWASKKSNVSAELLCLSLEILPLALLTGVQWIGDHRDPVRLWRELMQKLGPLAVQLRLHQGNPRRVEERMRQVFCDARRYRIGAEFVDDWDRPIALHHNRRCCSMCHDQLDTPPLELRDELQNVLE